MKLFNNYTYFRKCDTTTGWAAFLVAAVVYLMTIEPTASLWDCAEFIATSYKLEVMHPPGSPLFMMIARFFAMFAPSTAQVGMMVNAMSALASAFTILFLFWTISHLGRRLYRKSAEELTKGETWTIMGAALVGSLAYTFTDTFWFSAVEGEVYALSSLFTAVVVWAMFKWEEVADRPHANRWLVLIAYLMGLSIGVHILNLLAIPAMVFIYYFKKTSKVTWKGVVKATLIAAALLLAINSIIIPATTAIGAMIDRAFVNGMGLPMHTGLIFWMVLLFAAIIAGVYFTHKKGKVVLNTIVLCFGVIILGYSSYAAIIIRAAANPPMNSNDPNNAYGLLYMLNRDQYGNKPLLYGAQYSAPYEGITLSKKFYKGDDGKYETGYKIDGYEYPAEFKVFFPRMWSAGKSHIEGYKEWGHVTGQKKIRYGDRRFEVPTAGENLRFFFSYQLNFMYWRYFLWNFVGRQSDNQSYGEIVDGQWLSGIKFIDEIYLGPQSDLPSEMADNKGRNKYYFLPFILGLIGLIFHLNRDPKNFTVVMWLFIMMGVALVFYFNTTPYEPRERDYVYAGSFYAFCIWVGLGVMCVREWVSRLVKKDSRLAAVVATAVCACVPVIMAAQNWDDHDRSHRYVARDIGWNYLQSCLPNSIVMNFGDNDTFPLWYNQEVEGVRPDVRIMNMSYLLGDWYADEMKYTFNESEPVPFSLPRHKYVYANEMLAVEDIFGRPVTVKAAIDFIKEDHPMTRVELTSGMTVDVVPAKKLLLPVNKENAIAAGIVRPEDAHMMVDTLEINIKGESIDRSEMLLLDLLANFDWKRPLYFTAPRQLLGNIQLLDYLQYDGYAYRLVPIKTPVQDLNLGRIDVDVLYHNLVEVFRYGNVADPRVYVDTFTRYNFNSTQIWNGFARLADGLTERGEQEKAVEVLDYGLSRIPVSQLGCNLHLLACIKAYYNAGAVEKGDMLFDTYLTVVEEYLDYFTSMPEKFHGGLGNSMDINLLAMMDLADISTKYGREEFHKRINDFIYGEKL